MAVRDILNYLGDKIGELELPDGTSDEVWALKLAPYAVAPPSAEEQLSYAIQYKVKDRIAFSTDLIQRFKERNITDGINGLQGFWMHHQLRALPVTFMGMNFTIDVMNLVVSGDVEIATLALLYSSADDMTQPYHWLSQARKDWLIGELKSYLGWP